MKRSILLVSFILINLCVFAQTPTKVLYLGNSYTYVNDLTDIVERLSQSQEKEIQSTEFLSGGARFQTHWNNSSVINTIKQGGFDFMILQGQSQEVAFPQGQFLSEVYPYAQKLDSLFKAYNPNGKVIFFMTWGYRYGDATNCPFYPPFCTYSSMSQELYNNYRQMSLDFQSSVAPIGAAWSYSINLDSNYVLHSPDNSHPSYDGSYLAACVLYSSIFKENVNSSFNYQLDTQTAQRYQQIANEIVMDSLSHWNLAVLSTNEMLTNNISADVYYNEKESSIKIDVKNIDEDLTVSIFDINAKLIGSKSIKPTNNIISTSIDISNQNKRLYIIKLESSSFSKTFKIVK
ncbi:MAG TPA: hypothetical protein DD434_08520 [Bacteroidales bacterium]|nr:hypothetical protein [Bacteroidales bacterium]